MEREGEERKEMGRESGRENREEKGTKDRTGKWRENREGKGLREGELEFDFSSRFGSIEALLWGTCC